MAVVTPNTQIVAITANRRARRPSGRSPAGGAARTSGPTSAAAGPAVTRPGAAIRPLGFSSAEFSSAESVGDRRAALGVSVGAKLPTGPTGLCGTATGRGSPVSFGPTTLTTAGRTSSVPGQSGTMRTRYSPFLNLTDTAAPSATAT